MINASIGCMFAAFILFVISALWGNRSAPPLNLTSVGLAMMALSFLIR
jgi:hypothetical protein